MKPLRLSEFSTAGGIGSICFSDEERFPEGSEPSQEHPRYASPGFTGPHICAMGDGAGLIPDGLQARHRPMSKRGKTMRKSAFLRYIITFPLLLRVRLPESAKPHSRGSPVAQPSLNGSPHYHMRKGGDLCNRPSLSRDSPMGYIDHRTQLVTIRRLGFFGLRRTKRIFTRPRTIIGRNVRNCHPPASVHVVKEIVNSFGQGTRDVAEFWIKMGDKYVYIRYFAVRDGEGAYRGTFEVSQEISGIKELEGERRLLDD